MGARSAFLNTGRKIRDGPGLSKMIRLMQSARSLEVCESTSAKRWPRANNAFRGPRPRFRGNDAEWMMGQSRENQLVERRYITRAANPASRGGRRQSKRVRRGPSIVEIVVILRPHIVIVVKVTPNLHFD
jgi:hypothetical protein